MGKKLRRRASSSRSPLRKVIIACSILLGTCQIGSFGTLAAVAADSDVTLTSVKKESRSAALVPRSRGLDTKLDTNLKLLAREYSTSRGPGSKSLKLTAKEKENLFGLKGDSKTPHVEVGIKTTSPIDKATLEKTGAIYRYQIDDLVFARVPVTSLNAIGQLKGVESIQGIRAAHNPIPPKRKDKSDTKPSSARGSRGIVEALDRKGLTGKDVIVGIVDSGIDWKHPDFVRADGTSRILYLYDMTDDSWTTSKGSIGSKPPVEGDDSQPLGTLYTNEQINAALAGKGTINSQDDLGHGTACAGIAAGNGSATANDVPKGTYTGLAPEADLIIVRAGKFNFPYGYHNAVHWVSEKAKELKKPCVINLSLGTQFSAHDGNTAEEQLLSSLCKKGNKGLAICVAAGNERGNSFHAGGHFAASREGQADTYSNVVELFNADTTTGVAYFDPQDDWAFAIRGRDKFLVDSTGRPVTLFIWKEGSQLYRVAQDADGNIYKGPLGPDNADTYADWFDNNVEVALFNNEMYFQLPQGQYYLWTYGATDKVKNGRFDLYLPMGNTASFGKGNESRFMVGTPGNAKNVITVGAYDYQSSWQNLGGEYTYYNLPLGEISDYSNPGYTRDGAIKPEIVAPATYQISSLARLSDDSYCAMGIRDGEPDKGQVTKDGYHLAWAGTSAATPYMTGLVALMLEKNPKLDCQQIKEIICNNGKKDDLTGGVPNRDWGFGKVDPGAVLKSTPSRVAQSD